MVTTRELAIARSVIYASLDERPLTLEELHRSLVGSEQTLAEVLSVYEGSEMLRALIECRDGSFFPAGRADLLDERRRREARSRAFLDRHALLLGLICCLPFVRLVALSGPISRFNLEAGGDIDLFIVARGRHVWSTASAVRVLAGIMSRRCMVRAKVIVDEAHLSLGRQDHVAADHLLHLRPLVGAHVLQDVFAANPCVAQFHPNAPLSGVSGAPRPRDPRLVVAARTVLELVVGLPSPIVEAVCRWVHGGGASLVDMPQPRQADHDLFAILPDAPGSRAHAEEQLRRVQGYVDACRPRTDADAHTHKESPTPLGAGVADRKRR
jgi:hypothetical protein